MIQITINTNSKAKVKLTVKGKHILVKHYEADANLSEYNKKQYESVKEYYQNNDDFTTELWKLMSIFGHYLYNGCDIPFVDNKIELSTH